MPKITFLYHHLFVISFHTVNKMLFKLGAGANFYGFLVKIGNEDLGTLCGPAVPLVSTLLPSAGKLVPAKLSAPRNESKTPEMD